MSALEVAGHALLVLGVFVGIALVVDGLRNLRARCRAWEAYERARDACEK